MYFYLINILTFVGVLNTYAAMSTREQRLYAIRKIVQTEVIRSQDDLLNALARSGFDVTQATLSRDIKHLNVIKQHDGSGLYVYTLSEAIVSAENAVIDIERLNIEFSGSLAVIKTRPGYAMGIASDIDTSGLREILGTIAGDDTILIIPREGYTREQVTVALTRFIN